MAEHRESRSRSRQLREAILPGTIAVALLVVAACGGEEGDRTAAASGSSTTAPTVVDGVLDEVPAHTRVADGGPAPRAAEYWIEWSSCGPGSRPSVAAANGGRDAGWLLLDDLLESPGVYLGEYQPITCDDGVATLRGTSSDDPIDRLAGQELTAELNLSTGTESCAVVEGVLRVARTVLAAVGYQGPSGPQPGSFANHELLDETITLLTLYSQGELCLESGG